LPRLHWEWAAYNPIRDRYLEMIVAVDALNRLVPHLCAVSAGGNMNLLFGFTVLAFHHHHEIALVGHRRSPVRLILLRTGSGSVVNSAHPGRSAVWAKSIVDTTQYHSRSLVAPSQLSV